MIVYFFIYLNFFNNMKNHTRVVLFEKDNNYYINLYYKHQLKQCVLSNDSFGEERYKSLIYVRERKQKNENNSNI